MGQSIDALSISSKYFYFIHSLLHHYFRQPSEVTPKF